MAISDAQKVDLLYKKYFGVAKTDTSTNKGAGNESIPSSVFVRNDKLWYQSGSIPGVAANVSGIVQPYLTTQRVALSADNTTTPISNVYPTWKANLTDWVPPEFGATYAVKIYAENGGNTDPSGNTTLSDSGIGGVGEWNFDYQSGVLNFIGGTIPAVLTGSLNQTKVLYLTGYRYIGAVGAPSTTDLVANIANVVLSISNVSQSISQLTNRLNANTITADVITSNSWNRLYTANVVETAGNLYFTNTRVIAALYNADLVLGNISSITSTTSTFVANIITANTIAPTRVTGNLVVDNNLFANGFVLQGTDLTNSLLNLNSSNVIYAISAEQSNVNYSANLKLTGTNNGNVTVQDQVSFKGTGLVRISRQDSDTIVINAGIASVVATPVPNSATEITRFSTSVYRTAEFIYTSNTASYTDPSYAGLYNAGKILLLHNGTNVIFTQYAILQTGNGLELASFSATINSGNVILYATAATGVAATVKLSGITYTEI
jgi:hypothetical protein